MDSLMHCHVHAPLDECSICLSGIATRDSYDAGCSSGRHVFHKKCAMKWFEKSNTCPLCRERIVNPMSHTRDDLISYMIRVMEANSIHMLDDHMTVFHMDDTFRLLKISFAHHPQYAACFCMNEMPVMNFIRT